MMHDDVNKVHIYMHYEIVEYKLSFLALSGHKMSKTINFCHIHILLNNFIYFKNFFSSHYTTLLKFRNVKSFTQSKYVCIFIEFHVNLFKISLHIFDLLICQV